jgi:hypothetical protein
VSPGHTADDQQQHDRPQEEDMPTTNVTVSPGAPLYVTDSNRTFDTVTVEPGGQIYVQTIANVTITTLDIQAS